MSLTTLLAGHFGGDLIDRRDDELRRLTADARGGIAWLEGFLTRAAREGARREAAGGEVVASDLLRGDGEVSRQRADALAARAAVADTLPGVGEAIGAGEARPENADAVAAALGRMSATERARLAGHDADLARRAATDSPEVFARHLGRQARAVRDPEAPGQLSAAEREKAASHFGMGRRPNGRWWLNGDLDGERGSVVNDRIRARARELAGDQPVTPNHLAQALCDLITGNPANDDGTRARMGIGYIVDAATLFGWTPATPTPRHSPAGPSPAPAQPNPAQPDHYNRKPTRPGPAQPSPTEPGPGEPGPAGPDMAGCGPSCGAAGRAAAVAETWSGDPVDPAALRRLACGADLYAILIGAGGEPRGTHQTHRSASRVQRLSLRALYPTCPLDGVTPFGRCEIHHVNLAHGHGGPTELANLVPISSRWHHRIHDLGWNLTMLADRTLELRSPDGRLVRVIRPPEPITRQQE